MDRFLEELSSSAPTPGGGGASALIGAVSCALCSMVANLTTGKKKYAMYQDKIDEYLVILSEKLTTLKEDIELDATAFAPLAKAYSMDKNAPDYDIVMQTAIKNAAEAPLKITRDIYSLVPIIEDLETMGSRLAISDVAVAATAAVTALKGAVMNIYINTKSMKDTALAIQMNNEAAHMVEDGEYRLNKVYDNICKQLRNV
ncbi:MAG: cyclodeaminase/cyclohydrolase family protein [Lachnospiraceae bacterium]|nr:cyclodeaminase/cyclohydrolase family protein [Candidatus Colinaster equi]